MRQYRIKMTRSALQQMEETRSYIMDCLLSPISARRWLQKIKQEIATLSEMPNRYPQIEEEPWYSLGVRRMVIQNFLLYYWVNEVNRTVYVTAIVYGKRNQLEQLSKMDMM